MTLYSCYVHILSGGVLCSNTKQYQLTFPTTFRPARPFLLCWSISITCPSFTCRWSRVSSPSLPLFLLLKLSLFLLVDIISLYLPSSSLCWHYLLLYLHSLFSWWLVTLSRSQERQTNGEISSLTFANLTSVSPPLIRWKLYRFTLLSINENLMRFNLQFIMGYYFLMIIIQNSSDFVIP